MWFNFTDIVIFTFSMLILIIHSISIYWGLSESYLDNRPNNRAVTLEPWLFPFQSAQLTPHSIN